MVKMLLFDVVIWLKSFVFNVGEYVEYSYND